MMVDITTAVGFLCKALHMIRIRCAMEILKSGWSHAARKEKQARLRLLDSSNLQARAKAL